jgi:hypothetical protein
MAEAVIVSRHPHEEGFDIGARQGGMKRNRENTADVPLQRGDA